MILRSPRLPAAAAVACPSSPVLVCCPATPWITVMGHRLSKIVTRTGDAGTTGLGDGSRVAKDSARIDAIGDIDELNSTLGLLLSEPLPDAVAACLTSVQHDLFDLGGELSIPGHVALTDAHVLRLEAAVEAFNADLGALKEFILPGGTRAAAIAHVARTVCRRAERTLVRMAAAEPVSDARSPLRQSALRPPVRARANVEPRRGNARRALAEEPPRRIRLTRPPRPGPWPTPIRIAAPASPTCWRAPRWPIRRLSRSSTG